MRTQKQNLKNYTRALEIRGEKMNFSIKDAQALQVAKL